MQDKMWRIILISLLALKGSLTDADNDFSFFETSNSAVCDNEGYAQYMCISNLKGKNVVVNPASSEEELDEYCPDMEKFSVCVEDSLKYCSDLAEAVVVAKAQVGVLRDLCDKDSDLRKAYLRIAPCYTGLKHYYPYDEKCVEGSLVLYDAYVNSSRIQVQVGDYDKKSCFSAAYATACMIATVDRVCGDDASSVLIEILTRARSLQERCPFQYIEEVKNEFFQFLVNTKLDRLDNTRTSSEVDEIIIRDDPQSPGMIKAIRSL